MIDDSDINDDYITGQAGPSPLAHAAKKFDRPKLKSHQKKDKVSSKLSYMSEVTGHSVAVGDSDDIHMVPSVNIKHTSHLDSFDR